MPCQRHHQQPPVPERDDERPTFAREPARPFAALDAPAIGQIDEADVAMGDPAGDPPQQIAAKKTPPGAGLGQFHRYADTARGATAARSPLFGELHRVEPRIEAVAGDQLRMPAGFDELPAIDDADQIGTLNRRQPVRDHQSRAPAHQRPQSCLNLPFRFAVEGRGRLVEQQDRRVLQHRPGDRDTLALAAGEADAVLADQGVVTLRQLPDELVSGGGARRRHDLLRRRRRIGHRRCWRVPCRRTG